MDCKGDAHQAPGMQDTGEQVKLMKKAIPSDALLGVNFKFGQKWWAHFQQRHRDVVGRKPELVESQRATARSRKEQWLSFSKISLQPSLSLVIFERWYMHNRSETSFFRNFETLGLQCGSSEVKIM